MPATVDVGSWLLLAIRWVHLVAAATWVGGGLVYLVVLGPALRGLRPEVATGVGAAVSAGFREVVQAAMVALVVTGVVLAFDRLSDGASMDYAAVLALKVGLSAAMFWLASELGWARRSGKPGDRRWPLAPANLVLVVGLVVFFLALVLRTLAPE